MNHHSQGLLVSIVLQGLNLVVILLLSCLLVSLPYFLPLVFLPFFLLPFAFDRAIATACFCGLPAAISFLMLLDMTFLLLPFFNVMLPPKKIAPKGYILRFFAFVVGTFFFFGRRVGCPAMFYFLQFYV